MPIIGAITVPIIGSGWKKFNSDSHYETERYLVVFAEALHLQKQPGT
jgi:hypothetical protein